MIQQGCPAYTEEVGALSGLPALGIDVGGVRWTPGTGVVSPDGMLDLDDFGTGKP